MRLEPDVQAGKLKQTRLIIPQKARLISDVEFPEYIIVCFRLREIMDR